MAAVAPMAMERDARVPCCEPLGCVTDCVYPWCMFTCDTCCWATLLLGPCLDKAPSQPIPGYCLWPSHKVLKKDPKRAAWLTTKFDLCQRLDRYTIRHPRCRCCGVGFGSELHASTYLGGSFYGHYDDMFGANFCCGQKVVVAEPRLVETSLLEPSGRGFHLHMYNLRGEVMPKIGGETSFLLALPNGDDATTAHAKLRALVFKYCAGPAAIARARPRDPVAAALLWKLRTSCAEDPANAANVHFPRFVVRFVHWCSLGMRDIDDGAFALLFEANITPVDAGEFPPHGVRYLHREMNLCGEGPVKHFPELHAKIAALYAAALRELRFEGEFCAAEDFAASLVPIMALAGCFGPLDALLQLFPEHNKWSNLADPLAAAAFAWPWDDRAKLRLCAMEAQRLSPGVFGTTQVCRRPFSTRIGSEDVAFPAGTKMMLNYRNYGKNAAVFGDETDKWKPYDRPANGGKAPEDGTARPAFDAAARCPFFNGVGDRTGGVDAARAAGLDDRACGRICPGRDLALELVVSALQVMRAPSDDDARRLLGAGPAVDGT